MVIFLREKIINLARRSLEAGRDPLVLEVEEEVNFVWG